MKENKMKTVLFIICFLASSCMAFDPNATIVIRFKPVNGFDPNQIGIPVADGMVVRMRNDKTGVPAVNNATWNRDVRLLFWRATPFDAGNYVSDARYGGGVIAMSALKTYPCTLRLFCDSWLRGNVNFRTYAANSNRWPVVWRPPPYAPPISEPNMFDNVDPNDFWLIIEKLRLLESDPNQGKGE